MDADAPLKEALGRHFERHGTSDLYLASMDHSPSEQLSGESSYTTVLVMSPAVEHSGLARAVAGDLRPKQRVLCKWNRATRAYRRNFWPSFTRQFASVPVYVFAVSASDAAVRSNAQRWIDAFGHGRYRNTGAPAGNPIIEIGPVVDARTQEKRLLTLPENRALMCLHIAGFVLGTQRAMYDAANPGSEITGGLINWNFFADKFPGDLGGDMETFFCLLIRHQRHLGLLRWGAFRESDQVETDLLADNLAGLLNENSRPDRRDRLHAALPRGLEGGLFYWVVAV